MSTTLEDKIRAYVAARDAVQALEAKHEAELGELKTELEEISNDLLSVCNEQNVDSLKTPAGTLSRRVSERFWTTDWGAMNECIIKHEAPFLLEHRIHNGNMRAFLEENPEAHPAGLQLDRKYVIQVRRPSAK
jgi:hypothetical protein